MNGCQLPPSIINNINGIRAQLSSKTTTTTPKARTVPSDIIDTNNTNVSNNNLQIPRTSKRTLCLTDNNNVPVPKKKRKKNGLSHSKLLEEFAHRSHLRNNVNLLSYHGKKQNIKTLCPCHDMLPVIREMEKDVFGHNDNAHTPMPIESDQSALSMIKNQSEWSCSGSPYKSQCRNNLFIAKELYEYEFNFEEIALPFMEAVVLGGPNPNICIQVNNDNDNNNNNENGHFKVIFKPLQDMALSDQSNTINVALKAISCGTFKRNLQPVPDACRITKLLDGEGCFISLKKEKNDKSENNEDTKSKNIYFKVSTFELKHRRKLQGTDSVLGVGFDCASRISWQKPRIYWMHQSIHTIRDKSKQCPAQKKQISNRDLRFSLLVPRNFKGSFVVYLIGIPHTFEYNVNTNIPTKRYERRQNENNNIVNNENANGNGFNLDVGIKEDTVMWIILTNGIIDGRGSPLSSSTVTTPPQINNINNNINNSIKATLPLISANPNNDDLTSMHLDAFTHAHQSNNNRTPMMPSLSMPIPMNATYYQQSQAPLINYGNINNFYTPSIAAAHAMDDSMTLFSSSSNNMNMRNGNNPFCNNSTTTSNVNIHQFICDDLEHGRKTYINYLCTMDFANESNQTFASKWIRTCIERYSQNEDIYHVYLLNLVQCLINSIGDELTVRGLKKRWMSYNNVELEWSFLHMICYQNLFYLFESICNLMSHQKHALIMAISAIAKESKLRISPLYCCIVNRNYNFTKYLFDYFLQHLQSQDIIHIFDNGHPNHSISLIQDLINYHHTATMQQLINVNASRNEKFLTIQQLQLMLNRLQTHHRQQQQQSAATCII